MNRVLRDDHGGPDYALERELEELHDSLRERKARRVHVFKCPTCGAEWERSEEEMKGLKTVFCGSCSEWSPCRHDRIEIRDAEGNVGTVIV